MKMAEHKQEKRVLIVVANKGYQDESLQRFRDKMLEIDVQVDVSALYKRDAIGMLGSRTSVDYTLLQVDPALYEAVFFVGGEGTPVLWDDSLAKSLAQTFNFANKMIMACNNAPVILAKAGILKNRKATCAEAYKQELIDVGCHYQEENFVLDKNILTGKGSPICDEFVKQALMIVSKN